MKLISLLVVHQKSHAYYTSVHSKVLAVGV